MIKLLLVTLLLGADPAESPQDPDQPNVTPPAVAAEGQPATTDSSDALTADDPLVDALPEISSESSQPVGDPSMMHVQVLDGDGLVGRLVSIDPESVTLTDLAGYETKVVYDDILSIAPRRRQAATEESESNGSIHVDLLDGSSFYASSFAVEEGKCTVKLDAVRTINFPTQSMRRIRLIAPTEDDPPEYEQEWSRLSERETETDILVAARDGKISYHFGFVRDVTEDKVQFELDGDILPVPRGRVFGIILRKRAEDTMPATLCKLSESDGSNWSIRTLSYNDDRLTWTTPLKVEGTTLLPQIGRIDFSQGKILFLSDIGPESTKWTPYFDGADSISVVRDFFLPRQDQNLRGGTLTLDDDWYFKGLSIHSHTIVTYRLPDRYSRFRAVVGIDDSVRPSGNVQLIISGDGKELLKETFTGKMSAKPLDLDIAGVRRLTIEVGFGEKHDHGDMLDLCNARVVK